MTIDPTLLSALRTSPLLEPTCTGETSPRNIDGRPAYSRASREPLTISVGKRKLQLAHDATMTWWSLELGGACIGRDGGDAQVPPYPDALRGIEVEQLARAAAIKDNLVHPGPLVALLARFAPNCDDDHADRWRATLAAAFRWLGVDRPRVRYRFWDDALLPAFDSAFCWRHSDHGMVIEATGGEPPTRRRRCASTASRARSAPSIPTSSPSSIRSSPVRASRTPSCRRCSPPPTRRATARSPIARRARAISRASSPPAISTPRRCSPITSPTTRTRPCSPRCAGARSGPPKLRLVPRRGPCRVPRMHACPHCQQDQHPPTPIGFTWWGGILGPKLLSHVQCPSCGGTFNSKTGQPNTTSAIAPTTVAVGVLAFALIFAVYR